MGTGELSRMVQAVYPLAASIASLQRLGVESLDIPVGASLLVLGNNCD